MSLNSIKIYSGDTVNFSIVFLDDNKDPINISNKIVVFMVKSNIDDVDLNAVVNETIVIPNDSDSQKGIAKIKSNVNIPVGNYFYGITYIDNSITPNLIETVVVDEFFVIKTVRKGI